MIKGFRDKNQEKNLVDKTIRMARVSAKGGFHLFLGVALSSIISAVGTIIVGMLLGQDNYGLYAIALIPPSMFTLFRDWGVSSAMIKYIAQYRSENKTAETKNILASGMLFEVILGVLLSFISFSSAGFLAANMYHQAGAKHLIEIASTTILTGSLITVAQSVFTGFERMEFSSLTLIWQSTTKSLLAAFLAFLGYGAFGAVLGYTIAFIVTGALGVLIVFFLFYRNSQRTGNNGINLSRPLKIMLKYGWPLYVSTILGGFFTLFLNFIMPIYCKQGLIGSYQMALNFTVIITFFTIPIATVLFPAFSKLDAEKEKEILKIVFQASVKYAALVTIPVTAAIMVLSEPFVFTLLPKWSDTPLFLTFYALNFLYSGLGSLSIGSFLNGQGKTKVSMLLNLITLMVGVPLSLVLIPRFRILGLIATILLAGIPSLALGLHWIKRDFGITIGWISSAKIFLSSGIAAAVTYLTVFQLNFPNWVKLVVGGTVFLIVYIITILIIGALNQSDINNLREMLSELGPFSRLFNFLLNLVEKLLTVFSSSTEG